MMQEIVMPHPQILLTAKLSKEGFELSGKKLTWERLMMFTFPEANGENEVVVKMSKSKVGHYEC